VKNKLKPPINKWQEMPRNLRRLKYVPGYTAS
jgi:hypothetical protein